MSALDIEKDLLPCPFCGSISSMQRHNGESGSNFAVWCDNCHIGTAWVAFENLARMDWNRRAPAPSIPAQTGTKEMLPCPFCGGDSVHVHDSYVNSAGFMVLCGSCTAEGPLCDNEADAAKEWNRRMPVPSAGTVSGGGLPPLPKWLTEGDEAYRMPRAKIAVEMEAYARAAIAAAGQGAHIDYNALVESMCLTMRHDYGLERTEAPAGSWPFGASSGMTKAERQALQANMRQLVEHCIKPAITRAAGQGGEDARDAARYRALIGPEMDGLRCAPESREFVYAAWALLKSDEPCTKEALDAVIDAAIAAKEGK